MNRRTAGIFVLMIAVVAAISLLAGGTDGLWSPRGETGPGAVERPATTSAVVQRAPARVPGVPPEVYTFFENEQYWRAARRMRSYLAESRDAPPEAVLLAARAEAGWGGWQRVVEYLDGRDWLDRVAGGEGWFWLATAREQAGNWRGAADAYARYLAGPAGGANGSDGSEPDRQTVARIRYGLALLHADDPVAGAAALASAREREPSLAEWLDVLAAEALASRGDTASVRRLTGRIQRPDLRPRSGRALIRTYIEADAARRARAVAASLREEAAEDAERASLALREARLALELGDQDGARSVLLTALRLAPGGAAGREAARLLSGMDGLSTENRLTVARVLDRHGNDQRAARGYRRWLEAGAGSESERRSVRLALGAALFDAGDYSDAEAALRPLVDAPESVAARAGFIIGRAQYRRGQRERAFATWQALADRFPGSGPGAEGLFLVADLSHDEREMRRARSAYRQVASEFVGTDRAGLALMRLGGIAYIEGEYADAAEAWEEYRTRYPAGERWLEASYWAARSYQRLGRGDEAGRLYRQIRQREPLSYYSVRAAQRLGEPFWPVPMGEPPQTDAAAALRVEEWMRPVDLLAAAGLHSEAESEADRAIGEAGSNPALLYPLGEALNQRGLTVRGVRVGRRLMEIEPQPNERLLRIVYPFPYRAMIHAEAVERGLDPHLVAALIRQESLFKARIASAAGARGLMQVMPETGRLLARSVGIPQWNAELLYQPEINAHLGIRYLSEQMEAHDGSLPSVFSAYNAGPRRIQRWRNFPEFADPELFTERVPFRETRDYIKILTRNIEVYEGLYPDG